MEDYDYGYGYGDVGIGENYLRESHSDAGVADSADDVIQQLFASILPRQLQQEQSPQVQLVSSFKRK